MQNENEKQKAFDPGLSSIIESNCMLPKLGRLDIVWVLQYSWQQALISPSALRKLGLRFLPSR
jgi:hypothetical protein